MRQFYTPPLPLWISHIYALFAVAFLQPNQPPICTHSSGSWAHAARSYFDGRGLHMRWVGMPAVGAADHYRVRLCADWRNAVDTRSLNLTRESRPIPLRVLHALYMRAAVKVRAALIQFSLAPQPPPNNATADIAGTTGPGGVGDHPCVTFALWGRE